MNIRDLKYIVAVAENNSFGAAAKKEYVSQPALSMQVAKLENELGIKIFERHKKKFIITKVGQMVIDKAKKILNEVNDLKNDVKFYQNPLQGNLIVGAFPTLASYFFPNFLEAALKKFPEIKFFLVEEKTDILIKKLLQGDIDIAFLANPIYEDNLSSFEIFTEQFYLAVNSNHRLAKKSEVSFDDIDGNELMLLDEGHCLRNQALEVCFMTGIRQQNSFRATSLETLRQMVAIGAGITLIPNIALDNNPNVKYIPFKEAPKRSISIFYRKSYSRSEVIEGLFEIFKK